MKKKQETSRDLYTKWAKKLPKNSKIKIYQNEEMFTAVIVPTIFNFEVTYSEKKKTPPKKGSK